MLLRLILLFSLIAAVSTVLAAPPRFGFQEPDSAARALVTKAPPATAPSNETAEAKPEPAQASPVASEGESPQMEVPQAVTAPSPMAIQAEPVSVPKQEKRGFFWMFNRKKDEPPPQEHKSQDALVPTNKYYKSPDEKIKAAGLYEYRSGYQSYWKDDSSKVLCSIRQQIPNYGYVEFRQGVGQPLEFAMFVNHPPAGVGKAHVRIQAPNWRHYSKAKDLGIIELESGKRAVTMEANWSNRLLLELRDGMQPVLRYWDAADASTDIEIMLSALNFQESLGLFHNCLGKVLTYDVLQAEHTVVHFHPDSSKLRTQATKQLDEILEILKADPGVKQVELELYSTREGLEQYNFRLSTRRARAVRDYLLKRGIAEDRVLIKIHTKHGEELKKLGYNPSDIYILLKRK